MQFFNLSKFFGLEIIIIIRVESQRILIDWLLSAVLIMMMIRVKVIEPMYRTHFYYRTPRNCGHWSQYINICACFRTTLHVISTKFNNNKRLCSDWYYYAINMHRSGGRIDRELEHTTMRLGVAFHFFCCFVVMPWICIFNELWFRREISFFLCGCCLFVYKIVLCARNVRGTSPQKF